MCVSEREREGEWHERARHLREEEPSAAVAPRVSVTGRAVAVLLRLHAASGRRGALLLASERIPCSVLPGISKGNKTKREGGGTAEEGGKGKMKGASEHTHHVKRKSPRLGLSSFAGTKWNGIRY